MQINTIWTVLLISTALHLSGCASSGTSGTGLSSSDRIRHFDSEYYGTFNAITRALKQKGYTLETADGNNGLVYTDYQLASTIGAPISGNHQIKVEAVIERQNDGTQVTLTLRVRQEIAMTGGPSAGVQEAEAKQYYKELFESISTQIK